MPVVSNGNGEASYVTSNRQVPQNIIENGTQSVTDNDTQSIGTVRTEAQEEEDALEGDTEVPDERTNIDMVMRWADGLGAYECLIIWAWVAPVCLLTPCAFMNILLMTHEPPHTCALPLAPLNFTNSEWMNLSIPRKSNGEFESCLLYDYPKAATNLTLMTFPDDVTLKEEAEVEDTVDLSGDYQKSALIWLSHYPDEVPENMTSGCAFGYNFSKTYFSETAVTEMGWVCDKINLKSQVLQSSILGNLAGCVIFGALADKIGRRKVFLFLTMKVAILGSIYVFLRDIYVVLRVRFVLSMGLPIIYQIVIISAMEQVRDSRRGMVTSISSVFFSLGQCLMALLAYLTANWVTLGLVTSLPALLALVYLKVIEESPRWLVSRGKVKEAAEVIRRIARLNDLRPTHEDILAKMKKDGIYEAEHTEDEASCQPCSMVKYPFTAFRNFVKSVLSNFCSMVKFVGRFPCISWRTALLTVCWTSNLMIYFSIFMKISQVFDNPFLGFFLASIIEVPANLLVPLLLRRIGRRALHTVVMFICGGALLAVTVLLSQGFEEGIIEIKTLVLLAKFCTSITFLVVYLQAAELHPTPIRTCATGLASLIASSFNVATPFIVMALAKPWHTYLTLGIMSMLGALSSFLLPETDGLILPQTLEEAEDLGTTFFCRGFLDERQEGGKSSCNNKREMKMN